jgi:hypothetical protein
MKTLSIALALLFANTTIAQLESLKDKELKSILILKNDEVVKSENGHEAYFIYRDHLFAFYLNDMIYYYNSKKSTTTSLLFDIDKKIPNNDKKPSAIILSWRKLDENIYLFYNKEHKIYMALRNKLENLGNAKLDN